MWSSIGHLETDGWYGGCMELVYIGYHLVLLYQLIDTSVTISKWSHTFGAGLFEWDNEQQRCDYVEFDLIFSDCYKSIKMEIFLW